MDTSETTPIDASLGELAQRTIHDLVEDYPATLSVLAPLGIDLCCGGAHSLEEAIELHGLDRATILPWIAQVISATRREL